MGYNVQLILGLNFN